MVKKGKRPEPANNNETDSNSFAKGIDWQKNKTNRSVPNLQQKNKDLSIDAWSGSLRRSGTSLSCSLNMKTKQIKLR